MVLREDKKIKKHRCFGLISRAAVFSRLDYEERLNADHHRIAKLGEGLVLDLADALARQTDLGADLFQRHWIATIKAIAQLEDLRLACVDLVEQGGQMLKIVVAHDLIVRPGVVRV